MIAAYSRKHRCTIDGTRASRAPGRGNLALIFTSNRNAQIFFDIDLYISREELGLVERVESGSQTFIFLFRQVNNTPLIQRSIFSTSGRVLNAKNRLFRG